MKKLLLAILLMVSFFTANSQVLRPSGLPTVNSTGRYEIGWLQGDSGYIWNNARDTFPAKYATTIWHSNGNFYKTPGGAGSHWSIWIPSIPGTVTSIATNAPVAGGTITTTGTISLDTGRSIAQIPTGYDLNKVKDSVVKLIAEAGGGTVLSFSSTASSGIIDVITLPSTTPTQVLSLGNITPTSVATSGGITAAFFSGDGRSLGGVVKYTDTSSMLSNLLRKTDTSNMLAPYLRASDTASMLLPYARISNLADSNFWRNVSSNTITTKGAVQDISLTGSETIGSASNTSYGSLITNNTSSTPTLNVNNIGVGSLASFSANSVQRVGISGQGVITTTAGVQGVSLTATGWLSLPGTTSQYVRGNGSLATFPSIISPTDTAAMLLPYLRKSDTATMLAPFVQYSDTVNMLSNLLRKTDTLTMLSPYLRKTDTASMLSGYARTGNIVAGPFQGTTFITPVASGANLSMTGNINTGGLTTTGGMDIGGTSTIRGTMTFNTGTISYKLTDGTYTTDVFPETDSYVQGAEMHRNNAPPLLAGHSYPSFVWQNTQPTGASYHQFRDNSNMPLFQMGLNNVYYNSFSFLNYPTWMKEVIFQSSHENTDSIGPVIQIGAHASTVVTQMLFDPQGSIYYGNVSSVKGVSNANGYFGKMDFLKRTFVFGNTIPDDTTATNNNALQVHGSATVTSKLIVGGDAQLSTEIITSRGNQNSDFNGLIASNQNSGAAARTITSLQNGAGNQFGFVLNSHTSANPDRGIISNTAGDIVISPNGATALTLNSSGIAAIGIISATGKVNSSALTASTALISDAGKNIISSSVTSTELGYVSGVTSSIQTQLNSKGTGNGTVTSVGTGYGLSGGAVTTTGTLIADSSILMTKNTTQLISADKYIIGGSRLIISNGAFTTGVQYKNASIQFEEHLDAGNRFVISNQTNAADAIQIHPVTNNITLPGGLTTTSGVFTSGLTTTTIGATGNIVTTGNIQGASITATGGISGTLTTAYQPNITSLGSLLNLTISGTLTVNSGIKISGGGSFDVGKIYASAVHGTIISGQTGSSNDMLLIDPTGSLIYMKAPTGQGYVVFGAPPVLPGYTVATLPAGVIGMNAYVTDALAPGFLTVVVGGGTVKTPVFYNGTNWVAH